MAFSTKYKVEYKDYSDGDWKIEFQFDPYGGSEISLTPGVTPCVIKEEPGEQGKYAPIIGSYCNIQLVYESAIDDLYTENAQEVKVIISLDASTVWTGYLSPGQYTRHFNQPKHYVTLVASDGLGELKDIKYVDGSDDPVYLQQPDLGVIAVILFYTGIARNINDAIDVFETDFDVTAADSAIAQTYSYAEKYWNEITDESSTAYVILSDILIKYGASIRQVAGEWWLYRPNHVISSTSRYRVFNALGQYQSNDTFTGFSTISDLGMTYMFADAELTKMGGVGSVEVTLNPPLRANLLKNGSFDDFTWNGVPAYWTNSGANIGHPIDPDALLIGSSEGPTQPTQYLSIPFNTYKAQTARLTLNWKAVYTGSPTHAKIMIVIVCAGHYYLTNNTWTTSAPPASTGWQYDLIADGKASMTDFEEITLDLPTILAGGVYGIVDEWEVRLYEFWNENSASTNYWTIQNAQFEVTYAKTILPTKIFTFDGPNTINKIEKLEINQGDSFLLSLGLGAPYDDMFYTLSSAVGLGDQTVEWYIYGDAPTAGTPIPIAELLAKQRVEGHTRSIDVLNASFRANDTLDTYKGIQDPDFVDEFGFAKIFCFTRLERDTRTAIYRGTWLECPATYTDTELEWASHDMGGDAVITGNSIEINGWTSSGAGSFAYFDDYTAVAGETIRLVVELTDDGSSDVPAITIDGTGHGLSWGTNYLTHYFASAGAKSIEMSKVEFPRTFNLTCVIDVYSITGI